MTSEKIFPVTLMKLVMLMVPASYCESDYKERREARGGGGKEDKVEEIRKNKQDREKGKTEYKD